MSIFDLALESSITYIMPMVNRAIKDKRLPKEYRQRLIEAKRLMENKPKRKEKKMIHYIAMAGLHGYLPQYCASHENYNDAVDDLANLHELGKNRTHELRKNGCIELNVKRDGNEYAEITECDCNNPECHNDF